MQKLDRTYKSFRNAAFSFVSGLLILILKFTSRTVFIKLLTAEYLGLNGLFANILSFLSLSELGIGSALNYSLYKPLNENNNDLVMSIMQLYRRCYTAIGIIIMVVGSIFMPFLPILIKDMPDISNIYLYYLIYVINSSVSYFYSYKRSLLISDQNEYVVSGIDLIAQLGVNILQIFVLLLTHSYEAYLLVMLFTTICENMVISSIADKKYYYLRNKDIKPLDSEFYKNIKINIKALFCHKIGSVIVFGTDNLIISSFLGLTEVGMYSNYTMITRSVDSLVARIFTSLVPSIGNLVSEQRRKYAEKVLYEVLLVNVLIYGLVAVCFVCLIQPFVDLCWGDKYKLEYGVVIAVSINTYINGVRKSVLIFKDATGNFWYDRYKSIVESGVNLCLSIALVKKLGIVGVLIGTISSSLVISFWIEAYVLFKHYWNSGMGKYILIQTEYATTVAIIAFACYKISAFIHMQGIIGLFMKTVTILFLYCGIFMAIWMHKKEVKSIANRIKQNSV